MNFLFAQIFIKQPGANARTASHQDQPYFAVDGEQVASLWTAAEPVTRENGGMGYVGGSHLWDMLAAASRRDAEPGPSKNEAIRT